MENSDSTLATGASASSSSSSPPSDRRLSLRSLTTPTATRKRGPAPSSFIHSEARSSTTLSTSSQEDQTIFIPHSRPHSRNLSEPINRTSTTVSTSRPSTARRLSLVSTKSPYDQSKNLWSQQSVLKRMSWGWNQTFAGLTPTQLTEVEIQRARPVQIDIPKRQSVTRPISTANSEYSTTSAFSTASSDTTTSTGTIINKPFANRRVSIVRSSRPEVELPPVAEEEHQPNPENDQDTEVDEMGIRRVLSTRFIRSPSEAQAERKRPVISLPALISTTNAQLTDSMDIHPALRNSGSSAEYSTTPTTPISETPGLTDSSSVGSSRSSTNGSPIADRFSVQPNHLTQYFPQLAPEKVADNVMILSDDVFAAPAPALPTRAPSHSKLEHERLARSRSMRSSGGYSRSSTQSVHREPIGRALTSPMSRHASLEATKEEQPFATELAQVNEVQEDFYSLVLEEQKTNDEEVMHETGYRQHTPSVYMLDLADLEATRWA